MSEYDKEKPEFLHSDAPQSPPLSALSVATIFGDAALDTGKHAGRKLQDIWQDDRNYLLWCANLAKNSCTYPPPRFKVELIRIAHLFESGQEDEAQRLFSQVHRWRELTEEGTGMSSLPRPSRERCMELIGSSTLLGGHADLDGIYSLAIAMHIGGALEHGKMKGAFSRLRLFRYGFRNLQDYTQSLAATADDRVVIIDYSAHPDAALNLDHHTTSLSYWDLGSPLPVGIYEPSMPSCPRLLATFCGLNVAEEILSGCDMVDGALYPDVERTSDLNNPFIALEYALSLDVSDVVAKKVALTLAEHGLDPGSVLQQAVWKSRIELLRHELEEQRAFWSRGNRIRTAGEWIAVADARLAPYSPSRFRYLPFENQDVLAKPYLITVRPGGYSKINLSVSRNPFYDRPDFYISYPLNLGALAKSMGKGGGRREVSSLTLETSQLAGALDQIRAAIELSILGDRI
jgi:hypothetical protein